MKSFSVLLLLSLVVSALAGGSTTVVNIVVNSPDHNVLEDIVLDQGLANFLSNGSAQFTVFAPIDDAFAALNSTLGGGLIRPFNSTAVGTIVTFHVLDSAVLAPEIANFSTTPKGTTLDPPFSAGSQRLRILRYVSPFNAVVIVNAAQVTNANIQADNGVVHVVDKVLVPGDVSANVPAVATATASLSTLVTAVGKASAAIQGALAGDGITVFAPSNEAFTKFDALLQSGFGVTLTQALEIQQVVDLILSYHVLPVVVYSKALPTNANITASTAASQSLTISYNSTGDFFFIRATGSTSKIVAVDVLASNGVVHVVDTVLIPDLSSVASLIVPPTTPAPTTPGNASLLGFSFFAIFAALLSLL